LCPVHKNVRSQEGVEVCPLWTRGGSSDVDSYWCIRKDKGEAADILKTRGKAWIFRDIVRTSFMHGPLTLLCVEIKIITLHGQDMVVAASLGSVHKRRPHKIAKNWSPPLHVSERTRYKCQKKNSKFFALKTADVHIWRIPLVRKMPTLDNPLTAVIFYGQHLTLHDRVWLLQHR